MSEERYVYFLKPVGFSGPIKIGSSKNPLARLGNYQVWSPMILELICDVKCHHHTELFLHRHFREDLLHGEWYSASEELLELLGYCMKEQKFPDWVDPPKNPKEFQEFCKKYPIAKRRRKTINDPWPFVAPKMAMLEDIEPWRPTPSARVA